MGVAQLWAEREHAERDADRALRIIVVARVLQRDRPLLRAGARPAVDALVALIEPHLRKMRARRAQKCAHPTFFVDQEYDKKSLCNFFLMLISLKLTILAQLEFC